MYVAAFVAQLLMCPILAGAQLSQGTAFVVSPGYLITNQHVVSGCGSVNVTTSDGRYSGSTIAEDQSADLALVHVPTLQISGARVRQTPPRLGEQVMVFGYPLAGTLASGGNFTAGIVSGLRGVQDAAGQIQITAPVQPGNSGGPLLDGAGAVIGVVRSKLNAFRAAAVTGDIPQNVNFAITGEVLQSFLKANKIPFNTGSRAASVDAERVARIAQEFTVKVDCENLALREEERTWEEVKRLGTSEAYRGYLSKFPAGKYAVRAREEIAKLSRQSPEPRKSATPTQQSPLQNVSVGPLTTTGGDRRDSRAIADDAAISRVITSVLINQFGQRFHVSVAIYNRRALITGEVADSATKGAIEKIVAGTGGLSGVINELKVGENAPVEARDRDAARTDRVRNEIGLRGGPGRCAVGVVTDLGAVYLLGLVTREEGDQVVRVAAQAGGIREVVKLFEYVSVAPSC